MLKQAIDPRPAKSAIVLILLLCAVAGSIDAVAYLRCGQIFVANMTGNTVLLAISLLQGELGKAALRGGLVAAFFAGVVVARLLARPAGSRVTKRQRIFVLGIELIALAMLAWRNAGTHATVLLPLLAAILGTQNGAFRYIGGIQLNTTFVTGDLELLGEAIVDAGNSLSRARFFLLSWLGYVSGGLLGALSALRLPHHGFLLPMVLALASLLVVTLMPEEPNP
jgi:uncharacterized membrane protein YoaK (UPF0700 family)